MQVCCGGENQSKPISGARYLLGRLFCGAVFTGYAGIIGALSIFDPGYRTLLGSYRTWVRDQRNEIRSRTGIVIRRR
jgi:hypothetical protein